VGLNLRVGAVGRNGAQRANKRFSFRQGSIGNFFLAGAMSFFRSLESAVFLFESITGIPAERLSVLPCIHTKCGSVAILRIVH
jgi:hypothetical protein